MKNFISIDLLTINTAINSLTHCLATILVTLLAFYFATKVKNYWNMWTNEKKTSLQFDGPPTMPLFGNAWSLIKDIDNTFYQFVDWSKKYPTTFRIWLGPQLLIVVTSPRDLQIIYNSSKASTKAFVYKFMEPLCINALINGSGPRYRAHRKQIIPYINGKSVLDGYIKLFNHYSKNCVDFLTKKADSGEFDISKSIEPFLTDTIYETVLGIPGTAQMDLSFPRAMEKMLDLLFQRIVTPWLYPSFMMGLTPTGWKTRRLLNEIFPFLDKLISGKRKIYLALERGEQVPGKPQTSVLDLIVENAVKTGLWDEEEIRSDLVAVFFGSNDTLLIAASFAILMLAMHEEAQDKVRAEVLSVVGDNDVTEEHLAQLKYTEMALKETLRLFPAGPVTAREITDDLEIENHTLPKGSTVLLAVCATHRSEKYWHDPEKYHPDRFSPENSHGRHPYAFVPFSGGYRMCPGFQYGLACLKVWIVHFVRNFKFATTMTMESTKVRANISTRSQSGYRVSITKLN